MAAAALAMLIRTTANTPERWNLPFPEASGEYVRVFVQPGMNARQAAEEFVRSGAVDRGYGGALARWMVRFSIDRRLRPGLYSVRKGTPWQVARQMRTVEPDVESLTLVPGTDIYSFGQIFPDLALSGKALEDLLGNDSLYPKEMLPFLPAAAEGRIAFLLPETYHLPLKTEKGLVSAAAALWWRRIGSKIPENLKNPVYFEESAIIASLVEREALWDEERPRIAGVIANRREKQMQLQIDATVVYAWKREGRNLTRVLFKDLEIDSPYNTYKVSGLPPAPICTPSEKSWIAVLDPESHTYLYYVAQPDGRHLFAVTYAEHLKNIRKARAQ